MAFLWRIYIVILGFFGFVISIGYRSVFSMVMVHVIKSKNKQETADILGHCTNETSRDLSLSWDVSTTLYFQTAYFIGSFFMQLPGGYFATRFSPSRVCGLSILATSILTVILPVPIQYGEEISVFIIRFLQGVVEGFSVPAMNGVISAWAPKSEKSRMVTVVYAGAYLSPAVAMVVTGMAACKVSWNMSLFLYGGLGILWSFVWLLSVYDTPDLNPYLCHAEKETFKREGQKVKGGSNKVARKIPWTNILRSLPMSAIVFAAFCRNWIFSMIITQVPQYFKDAFGKNIATIAVYSALPEVLMTIVTIAGGVLFDRLIKKHYLTTTRGRKLAQCSGFGIEAVCIFALRFTSDKNTAIALLCVGVGISGLAISGYQVNPLDLAPQYTSVLTGLARLGTLGAILSTVVAAELRRENIESWWTIFTIASGLHMAGVVYYLIFASGEKQSWADIPETKPLLNSAADPENTVPVEKHDKEYIFSASVSACSTGSRADDDDDTPSWFLNTI